MGRAGRSAVIEALPNLRQDMKLDAIVVNAENATSGAGLNAAHAAILEAGADCITLGDHAFDQKDMLTFIQSEPRIVRPLNYSKAAPGRGVYVVSDRRGRKLLVAQVLGQVFMKRPFDDPFSAVDEVLNRHPLGGSTQASLVDFHCEATSEKMAMGHYCNGRVSAVFGTHTHVPTADTVLLSRGTAFQSDAGMCGDYNSVIGMEKAEEPLNRFNGDAGEPFCVPALGEATLCGVFLKPMIKQQKLIHVEPVRLGGVLSSTSEYAKSDRELSKPIGARVLRLFEHKDAVIALITRR